MVALRTTKSNTQSIWTQTAPAFKAGELPGDLGVDVAIVGAGITGMTAAAILKKAGKRVAVIERQTLGHHGTTHRTTAHLTVALDQSYHSLIRKFGEEAVQHAVNASNAAIDWIEKSALDLGYDSEFVRVDGYYYAERDQNAREIDQDHADAVRLGIPAELTTEVQLPFDVEIGYRIPRQAMFHPLKHIAGLVAFVNDDNGAVYHNTAVRDFKDGEPCKLKTDRGTITARDVILATHTPMGVWASLQTRLVPYMSYVIVVRVRDNVPLALFWDNADPYNYIRRFSPHDSNLLMIGGADTKTGHERDTDKCFEALEQYARERFDVESIHQKWSAQFFEPADGLPYIGLGPGVEHTYVATGYSGTGMTYGTAAGMLIADLILKRENPWAETFKPSRVKPVAAAKKVLEGAAAAVKGLVTDRIFKIAHRDLESIPRGEGRVITHNGESLAVYRDEHGRLSARSSSCTHMGCSVEWNNAEKDWDCTCHGSRFDAEGQVIDGPATSPLEERSHESEEEDVRKAPEKAVGSEQ